MLSIIPTMPGNKSLQWKAH